MSACKKGCRQVRLYNSETVVCRFSCMELSKPTGETLKFSLDRLQTGPTGVLSQLTVEMPVYREYDQKEFRRNDLGTD